MQELKLNWKNFKEGNMAGISLYVNEDYASVAYKNGNVDIQMINDIIATDFPQDSIVFDIGACVGADSFVFAKIIKGSKVISFEPNEYNRNRFLLNLSHNPAFQRRISVFPYALGDKSGKLTMNISANIDGGHSSTSRIHQSHSKINNSMLPDGFFETIVDVVTLDEFVKNSGIAPNILKIDIEGAEHIMLAGAINTLEKHKPVIYMEIHSEYCDVTCYKILRNLNYSISIINEEEDNRLMIKAVFDSSEKKIGSNELMLEAQRSLNSSMEIMHTAEALLHTAESLLKEIMRQNGKIRVGNDSLRNSSNMLESDKQQLHLQHRELQKKQKEPDKKPHFFQIMERKFRRKVLYPVGSLLGIWRK